MPPHRENNIVQPHKKPTERRVVMRHADTSAGLHLFHEIPANEKALIDAIVNVRASSALCYRPN